MRWAQRSVTVADWGMSARKYPKLPCGFEFYLFRWLPDRGDIMALVRNRHPRFTHPGEQLPPRDLLSLSSFPREGDCASCLSRTFSPPQVNGPRSGPAWCQRHTGWCPLPALPRVVTLSFGARPAPTAGRGGRGGGAVGRIFRKAPY